MALLSKPSWLEDWLSNLNWDILAWHVYVGDAVESGIDWVLDLINGLAEWAAEIGAWWEDFRQEVVDFVNIIQYQIGLFLEDPIGYLQRIFGDYILPWAVDTIPFLAQLFTWYAYFRDELNLFLEDPGGYLRQKWEDVIFPWSLEHLPFFVQIANLLDIITGEFSLFLEDPGGYLRQKFIDDILPFAIGAVPFLGMIYHWYIDLGDRIENFFNSELWDDVVLFFNDPLQWLYDRLDEFVERFW